MLLIAAGDDADRLRSEASFAALCGVSPIEASSGKTVRHRLNRGGDRHANCALYTIVLSRLRWDARSHDYLARRVAEGKTACEAIRDSAAVGGGEGRDRGQGVFAVLGVEDLGQRGLRPGLGGFR